MQSKVLIVCISFLSFTSLFAQSTKERKSMTENLRSYTPGSGDVRIYQDARLDSLMNKHLINTGNTENVNGEIFVTSRGYRIQIFSGNNQRQSKTEAYAKETEIKEYFPTLDTYVTFQSPFWKLRVGNFRTSEEAHAMLRELKKNFPKWKEMFIVKDVIKFPVNTYDSQN